MKVALYNSKTRATRGENVFLSIRRQKAATVIIPFPHIMCVSVCVSLPHRGGAGAHQHVGWPGFAGGVHQVLLIRGSSGEHLACTGESDRESGREREREGRVCWLVGMQSNVYFYLCVEATWNAVLMECTHNTCTCIYHAHTFHHWFLGFHVHQMLTALIMYCTRTLYGAYIPHYS